VRTIPAVKIALLLALGIWAGDRWGPLPRAETLAAVAGLLTVAAVFRRSSWSSLPLSLAVTALGALLISPPGLPPEAAWADRPAVLRGRVVSTDYPAPGRQVSRLRPDWISPGGRACLPFPADLRLITDPDSRLAPGAVVSLTCEIHPYPARRNPGGRDWRREFARRGIAGWVKPDSVTVLQPGSTGLPERARKSLAALLAGGLPPREASLAVGMVLGDRGLLPENLADDFRASGLYHLLVVSGANIGVLLGLLTLLVSPFTHNLRLRRLALHGGIWGYVFLTGFAPPTVRAAVMASLLLAGYELRRVPRPWNLWGAAALVILLFDPGQLFQPGFQLSFAAMAGVLLAGDWRAARRLSLPDIPRVSRRWRRFLDREVIYAFAAGSLAVVFTAPILTSHFGGFAPLAALLNLPAIPLAGFIFTLSWMLILLHALLGLSLAPLAAGLELSLRALETLARWGADLPGNADAGTGSAIMALALAAALIGFLLDRRSRRIIWVGGLAVVWLFLPLENAPRRLEVEFLDVGQGDATLLRFPGGANLLVDAGSAEAARFELVPSLRRRGLTRLSAVAVSHFDRDHAGGLPEILARLQVDRLVVPSREPDDALGRSVLETARQRGIPLLVLNLGDTLAGFPGARLAALWPPDPGGGDNDASLVLKVDYGNTNLLLTGDVGGTVEERLLAAGSWLEAEALKVAHHGSRHASTRAFLEAVNPQWALIGCGAANRYGHPHPRVLADLEAVGARVGRTDRDGALRLCSDGDSLWREEWR